MYLKYILIEVFCMVFQIHFKCILPMSARNNGKTYLLCSNNENFNHRQVLMKRVQGVVEF
jgi:hypothetical protein